MSLYSDCDFSIPALVDDLHRDELASFSRTGTWGTAAERHAVANRTRKLRCELGVQEADGVDLESATALPDGVERVVDAVARGGVTIDRDFVARAQSEGVTEGAYVEIVGVVSRLVNLDVFARGLGVPMRKLDAPVEDGKPRFERPAEAVDEGFFTASVPGAPAGGAMAESIYGKAPAPNIMRTLSLVPAEARRLVKVVRDQYFDNDTFMDFSARRHHALSRAQMELVATKVSEHNQCFY